jgi:hypothetical protein
MIKEDEPQPLGPYSTPTAQLSATCGVWIRVSQNRMLSGTPSRSREPGNSSIKKSASLTSNERRPFGTILGAVSSDGARTVVWECS